MLFRSAQKAYFEVNPAATNAGDINTTGDLTSAISFILTGSEGSRSFSFNSGTNIGQIASSINNVADSTGINANLIFGSGTDALSHSATATTVATISTGGAGARAAGTLQVFNNQQSAITSVAAVTVTRDLKSTPLNSRLLPFSRFPSSSF